jgi:3-phosphoshikimate 1-carboxyvinyltransferase
MKKYIVNKSSLLGSLKIPSSKSQTMRAIIFASLATGKSTIYNYLDSPDTIAAIDAIKAYGARATIFKDKLEIIGTSGKVNINKENIYVNNSGILLRFITAILSLGKKRVKIFGDDSVNNRDMSPLMDALSQLNAKISSNKNKAPIFIQGPIEPSNIKNISGIDSQPISALLIATSFLEKSTEIFVKNPGEKPWIDLTMSWLSKLNIKYVTKDHSYYKIFGNSSYNGFEYTVPSDLSTIAFPIASALITNSTLTIDNIDFDDKQGDGKLIDALIKMGANIEIKKNQIIVHKNSNLQGMTIDINDYIDCITILAVIGCFANGKTQIINAHVARKKECDRISCICRELKKMNANIEETANGLIIYKSSLTGNNLNSYSDHRMALSLIIAALNANGESTIDNIDCIKKTYPTFLEDFLSINANIKMSES